MLLSLSTEMLNFGCSAADSGFGFRVQGPGDGRTVTKDPPVSTTYSSPTPAS